MNKPLGISAGNSVVPRLARVLFSLVVACLARQSFGADGGRAFDFDPKTLERAVVEAASVNSGDLERMLESGHVSLEALPLTSVFFLLRPRSDRDAEDFDFYGGIAKVDAFVNSLERSTRAEPKLCRLSVVNPKHIRRMLCVVNDGHGRGIIELDVEKVWHARLRFSCVMADGHWRITEFGLPMCGVRVQLQNDGNWRVDDPRGVVSRRLRGSAEMRRTIEEFVRGEFKVPPPVKDTERAEVEEGETPPENR